MIARRFILRDGEIYTVKPARIGAHRFDLSLLVTLSFDLSLQIMS